MLKYLFSWDEIPGKDNERIIEYIEKNFGIDWVKAAKIEKIDNGMTIRVFTENGFLSLKLNDRKNIVTLNINDGRTDKFTAKMENNRLNIYVLKNYDVQVHILWIGISIILIATLTYATIFSSEPNIPVYIPIWGFIGASTYILKTIVGLIGKGEFEDKYIPFHVARLAIGPSLAVVVYLIVSTGSVFGITLKTDGGQNVYVYSAIAFLSGYFVRHVVDVLSNILDNVLKLK